MPFPGPHSSILQTGGRSQDTAYRILHATWLNFKKDAGHIGYRMQTPNTLRSLVAPQGGRRMTGSAMKCNEMEMDVLFTLLLVEKV